VKDYAGLSYTEAFQQLLEDARRSYAFNGIEGKEPDWDALAGGLGSRWQFVGTHGFKVWPAEVVANLVGHDADRCRSPWLVGGAAVPAPEPP